MAFLGCIPDGNLLQICNEATNVPSQHVVHFVTVIVKMVLGWVFLEMGIGTVSTLTLPPNF